jgi:chromosome segregation ATPase
MEFFRQKVAALERELNQERERAQTAQNLLANQEVLRGEVDASLKALHRQLRQEKTERETEEEKSHARGRIDSLEKRLDEMHKTWAALLQDAIAQRDVSTHRSDAAQAGMVRDLGIVADQVQALKAQLEAWRGDISALNQVAPTLRALAREIPEEERRLLAQLDDRLKAFSSEVQTQLSDLARQQSLDRDRQETRLAELNRERAALQRSWEEQNHAIRQEHLKDNAARDLALGNRIADLCRRLEDISAGESQAAAASADLKAEIAKVMALLNTPPQAKDQALAELEREKLDLLKALKDRSDTLARYISDRREVEKTMGASMMELNSRLDEQREKNRELSGRVAELGLDVKVREDQLACSTRAEQEKTRLCESLSADRDGLAKLLMGETAKVRQQLEERAQAESQANARLQELQQRLEAELAHGAGLGVTISELRAQIATLSEHMAKALQAKDSLAEQSSAWPQEKEKLLQTLREKDEMISMLSATFQGMLKKEEK